MPFGYIAIYFAAGAGVAGTAFCCCMLIAIIIA
jgi:hypothetical protein